MLIVILCLVINKYILQKKTSIVMAHPLFIFQFKNGTSPASFPFIFAFQTNITISEKIYLKRCKSCIQSWDSNSRPSTHLIYIFGWNVYLLSTDEGIWTADLWRSKQLPYQYSRSYAFAKENIKTESVDCTQMLYLSFTYIIVVLYWCNR